MSELETPLTQIGDFRILREIGRGGMGCVYLAEDTQLHREVALKTMLPELRDKPIAKERFLREARAMAGVKSDHIVTIYHVSEAEGMPFFVMEYLEGQPLDQFLEAGKLTEIDELLRIAAEVCEGLRAAHSRGLIHRDIKPSNIFLESPNGRVKILDFGLARPQEPITELTRSGDVVGSPHYMAPEQAAGEPVDRRADLFSLGAMIFRMTTGKLPFKGNTTYEVLMSLATHTPPPLSEINPQTPGRLSQLVERLLRKKPDERPTSIDLVLSELQQLRQNRGAATNSFLAPPISISQASTVSRQPNPGEETTSLESAPTSAPPTRRFRRFRRPWWIAASLIVVVVLYCSTGTSEDPALLAREYLDAMRAKNFARLQTISHRIERLSKSNQKRVADAIALENAADPTAMFKGLGGIMTDMMQGMGGTLTDMMKGMGGMSKVGP